MKECKDCKYFRGFYEDGTACVLIGFRHKKNVCNFYEQKEN